MRTKRGNVKNIDDCRSHAADRRVIEGKGSSNQGTQKTVMTRRIFSWAALAGLTVMGGGCGKDDAAPIDPPTSSTGAGGEGGTGGHGGGGHEGPPEAVVAACEALQTKICSTMFACHWLGPYLFADEEDCVAGRTAHCASLYRPDGAGADAIEACAAAFPTVSCDDSLKAVLNGPAWAGFPTECYWTGPRSDGEACETNLQCASGICGGYDSDGMGCGTCQPLKTEGEACTGPCGPGLACVGGTCSALSHIGGPCVGAAHCLAGGWCDGGTCAPLLDVGEPCETASHCGYSSPVCNAVTHQCDALDPPAAIGEACFETPDGSLGLCAGAGCQLEAGATSGTCVELAGENQPCATSNDIFLHRDTCASHLTCVEGTCQLIGAALVCATPSRR
jgi:hypothetical protein